MKEGEANKEERFEVNPERLISDEERRYPYEIYPDVVGGLPPVFC